MLKKIFRLSKVGSFLSIKKVESDILTIKISKPTESPKFAFIVSKKVSKKAVERNRVKRILKSSIHKVLNNVKERNYLVIAKKEIIGKTENEVAEKIQELFVKENILK